MINKTIIIENNNENNRKGCGRIIAIFDLAQISRILTKRGNF